MSVIPEGARPTPATAIAETVRSTTEAAAPALSSRLPLFDRELSWLEFNRRVLGEAENPDVPLLERMKFLSICSNNQDEFFMIRVGEVRDLMAAKLPEVGTFRQQSEKLDEIRKRSRNLLQQMYACLNDELLPKLKKEGIQLERMVDLGKKERAAVEDYFLLNLE